MPLSVIWLLTSFAIRMLVAHFKLVRSRAKARSRGSGALGREGGRDVVLELQYTFRRGLVFRDPEIAGSIPIQALPSGPDCPTQNNQRFIVALIHAARRQIKITTPYFIPERQLGCTPTRCGLLGCPTQTTVLRRIESTEGRPAG
jgi:phosphatidylserine/phosphatidylglycerophosphate/cardiolipin synthase-like enzyme